MPMTLERMEVSRLEREYAEEHLPPDLDEDGTAEGLVDETSGDAVENLEVAD